MRRDWTTAYTYQRVVRVGSRRYHRRAMRGAIGRVPFTLCHRSIQQMLVLHADTPINALMMLEPCEDCERIAQDVANDLVASYVDVAARSSSEAFTGNLRATSIQ